MNNDFFYEVINFMRWILVIIIDLFNLIILLPLFLLIKAGSMNLSDFLVYAKRKFHWRLNELKKDSISLRVVFKNGKLNSSVVTYSDETMEKEDEMNTRSYGSIHALFDQTLDEVKQFTFITYEKDDYGTQFVQFGFHEGVYMFDFAMTRGNLNGDYSNDVLALLRRKGFKKYTNNLYAYRYKWFSILEESDDLTTIAADCGTDKALAIKLAEHVYTKIFKIRTYPHIRLG